MKLRDARPSEFADLRQKIIRWVNDHGQALCLSKPKVPGILHDRAADNWTPLLSIADLAGGEWPERARAAATELAKLDMGDEERAVMLLRDIRGVFGSKRVQRLHSTALLEHLVALEERPWSEWRRGKPLTASGLARMLKQFGIASRQLKVDNVNRHGYELAAFTDAFARYLSDEGHELTAEGEEDTTGTRQGVPERDDYEELVV